MSCNQFSCYFCTAMFFQIAIICILLYFGLLVTTSYFVSRKTNNNSTFFNANKQSRWYVVAFGMLSASISGISLVSVTGMVQEFHFSYLQTVIGFFFGYLVVSFFLLPFFYKINGVTIYGYLTQRFDSWSHKTASIFFIFAKTISAAAKLYISVLVLHRFVNTFYDISFLSILVIILIFIWLYTFRGGIQSIIWTDCIQTFFLILSTILILFAAIKVLNFDYNDIVLSLKNSDLSNVFVFNNFYSPQNFFKQFFSGIFIVIVMTGLDQDMMQKNLTCRTLKDAQKNMISYGIMFLPINFMFLLLGFLLILIGQKEQIAIPFGDELLPFFAFNYFGEFITICFIIGMIAASFSSADSAITAITTSFSIDILNINKNSKTAVKSRKIIHIGVVALFFLVILLFSNIENKSILDLIYTIVAYLYGPLLGLFGFGMLTKRKVGGIKICILCILSPIICFFVNHISKSLWNYSFGYELLLFNGLITFVGLYIFSLSANGNKKCRICH